MGLISTALNAVKGTLAWFRDLEEFCRLLERETIPVKSVYLNRWQFVEGFVDGKGGVHDRSGESPASPRDMVLLMEGAVVVPPFVTLVTLTVVLSPVT